MRNRVPRAVWVALFVYIAVSLVYQLTASVSLITGFFDLRQLVRDPGVAIDAYRSVITSVSGDAKEAGLESGDFVESLNGVPFTGRAQMQAARWHARPGERMQVGVRKPNGALVVATIHLKGFSHRNGVGEAVFVIVLQIVIPLLCLLAGYWVALARPTDLNAWLVLIVLSYPEAFVSVSTFNWWPGPWLVLRLGWHIILGVIAPAALLWLGLLFPERSRIDVQMPWLKWVVAATMGAATMAGLVSDYGDWYDRSFQGSRAQIDSVIEGIVNWGAVGCIAIYGIAIAAKLHAASTPDMKRRLRVLCIGSAIGLGTVTVVWGVLPRFGISPANIQWLGYTSAACLVVFPFSLAYVVLVQRAMDVSILVRTGTRYVLARTTVFLIEFAVMVLLLFRFVIPMLERRNDYALTIILPVFFFALQLRLYVVKRSPGDRIREWLDRKFFREAYNTELILSDLAVRARSISDPAVLIQTISERISEVLHVPRMAVLLRGGGGFRLQPAGGPDIEGVILLPEDSPPVRHLVQTSSPAVLYRDQPDAWFLQASGRDQDALNQMHAEVLLPLLGRSKLMGVMVLGPKLSEEPYSPSDLQLLSSVGAQTGLGLEINDLAQSLAEEAARHQRVQREVEIAREVQERLFPTIPVVRGLDIAGHCRPALGVGGDYYDVIAMEDGRVALAIGDISGKGIAAALLMASLRASLRGIVDAGSHDLARIVEKLNRLIHESSTVNRYATLFFAIYDPATRELRYVNAGHNAPVLLRGAEVLRLEACGPVVGLLKDVDYEEAGLHLLPGDLLIGYTDGISEAMTADEEEWGEERMQAVAERENGRSVKAILDAIFAEADVFTAGAKQYDDMTLLICRVTEAL
jgi:sigma-B regulation protein RsbU (phosphoserine phosphatase)